MIEAAPSDFDPNGMMIATKAPALPSRRKWIFRLAALASPFALVGLLEIAFRVAGYGGHPPVLADVGALDGRRYVGTVMDGVRPFFSANPQQAGNIEDQYFPMPKPANTIRIFVVGESAAQGYPQPRTLRLSTFLQAMLRDSWLDRNVEVINLGTTAIASFPVAEIAHQALYYEPDLLIVYTGNNEFYGAGGIASTHWLGRTARGMRLFHGINRSALLQGLRARRAPTVVIGEDQNLMDVVIGDAQVPFDDPRRQIAAQNLSENIGSIIVQCSKRGVPVIVCTCPGNERDLVPIGEDTRPALSSADIARFDALIQSARALTVVAPGEALAMLDEAAHVHRSHAMLQYLRGKCLAALDRDSEAAEAFRRARDLDTMPWRTPSLSNEAIRGACNDQAVLCDLERAFQEASPGGVIGWELMDDHVHPSLAGQALVAQALLRTMRELPRQLQVTPEQAASLPGWRQYAEALGANPLDAYFVVTSVTDLFERSFFQRSNPDALVRFRAEKRRMEGAMDVLTLETVRYHRETRSGAPITGAVAEAEFFAGAFNDAAQHFALARQAATPYSYLAARYGCLELEAVRRGALQPRHPVSPEVVIQTCRTFSAFKSHPTPMVDALRGYALGRMGRHIEAIVLIDPIIRQIEDAIGPVLAGQLLSSMVAVGQVAEARTLLQELKLNIKDLALESETAAALTAL